MKKLLSMLLISMLLITGVAADGGIRTMPSLEVSNITPTSIYWTLSGLSADFNESNYIRAGVAWLPVTNGSSSPSNNEVASIDAPPTGSYRMMGETLEGLDPWTSYTLYAWAQAANGLYYTAGEASFVTPQLAPVRPDDWSWSFPIYSGAPTYGSYISGNTVVVQVMHHTEWNDFTYRINQFRNYSNMADYPFIGIGANDYCTPAVINQAVNAINAMGFSIPLLGAGEIPASIFTQMRDAINSIQ